MLAGGNLLHHPLSHIGKTRQKHGGEATIQTPLKAYIMAAVGCRKRHYPREALSNDFSAQVQLPNGKTGKYKTRDSYERIGAAQCPTLILSHPPVHAVAVLACNPPKYGSQRPLRAPSEV
jgi:hypothetical protein